MSVGYAPVSIGTETVGSLILPASRAALYTLKPTVGLLPTDGIIPISSFADAPGPMAKSAEDLALTMDILVTLPAADQKAQHQYTDAANGLWNGLRIGTLDPRKWTSLDMFRKQETDAEEQMVYSTVSILHTVKSA